MAQESNQDRKTSNEKAQRTAGWYSDDAYMSEIGKEGTKRQQEKMSADADLEMAKSDKKSKKKISSTGKASSRKKTKKKSDKKYAVRK